MSRTAEHDPRKRKPDRKSDRRTANEIAKVGKEVVHAQEIPIWKVNYQAAVIEGNKTYFKISGRIVYLRGTLPRMIKSSDPRVLRHGEPIIKLMNAYYLDSGEEIPVRLEIEIPVLEKTNRKRRH